MHSLRIRITAFFLLGALIPIVLLYYYSINLNDEIKNERANELLDTAFLVNTGINQFFSDRIKILEVMADGMASKENQWSNLQPLPVPEFVDSAERLLDAFDSFNLLLQLDHRGRLLAAAGVDEDESEPIDFSALYKKDWSTESWFTDSISRINAPLNNTSVPLILKPLKVERVPGISRRTRHAVPIVVPVRNQSNTLLGIVVAFVEMEAIERFLKQGVDALAKTGDRQGHLHLIGKDGFVYARYPQKNHSNAPSNRVEFLYAAELANIRNNLVMEPGQTDSEISQWLISRSTEMNDERLVAYDKRSSAEDVYGLGWVVLIHLPTSEAFESINRTASNYARAMLVIIVLVIGFGFWVATMLTKPITSITEALSRLKEGSLTEKVDGIDRKDEVGQLEKVFSSFQYFVDDRNYMLRKQVKQLKELMQMRREMEVLMDSSNEPMLIVNKEGNIDRVNHAAEDVFGYGQGELLGEPVTALIPARFKDHDKHIEAYIKKPEYRSMVDSPCIVGLKKDGSEVVLDISLVPLESVDGIKALAILSDLTQERHYQEELRKLATVAEKTSNLVVVTDKDRCIEWVNDAFEKVTGYTREEVMGQKAGKMLRGKDTDPETIATINRAIYAGKAVQTEILNYTKDGQPLWLDIDIHPIYGDEGIEHYVAIETDMTERHLMEDQLRKNRDELEGQVEERTRDLSRALEEADAAVRAKSAFLAMMSHEIRTPINGVVGMAELLRNTPLLPRQIEMLDLISDSSHSLQRIIGDILDYSKIEAGKLDFEKVPVNMQSLIARTCEILGPIATSCSINLITYVDDKLPEKILADPVRVRQILYNLVGNSIKFTEPQGNVFIDIVTRDVNHEFARIEMIVRDTGIGMSMEDIDHLFTPFSQADESTTRRYGGTGLGLSICERLVEMMGGFIEVESTLGKGTTFRVKLDFPIVQAASGEVSDLLGIHVLKVSTPEMKLNEYADLLKSYINEAGATVDCLSGEDKVIVQAVNDSAQSGNPYDVVLICQQINSGDQYKICAALQALPEAERPKIMILVPQNDHHDYTDVAIVNGNPLNINKLLQCMAVLVGRMDADKVSYCGNNEDQIRTDADLLRQVDDETASGQKGLILVVEDNEVNQEVLNMQLSALGYDAMIAADGREALKLWKQYSFDLILTDCHMPEMDGFELTRSIRQAEAVTDSHIPIIAVTANAMSEELDRCLASGMDDCLTKPVGMDSLDQAINKWLPDSMPASPDLASAQSIEPVADQMNPPVDPQVLAKLTGGDVEQCKQLLVKFRDASIPMINELITASEEARFDDIEVQVHKLKSSARAVGAESLFELCLNLEQIGKNRIDDNLQVVVSQLTDEFERINRYIDQLV